jgi:hypothetical protein
MPRVSWFRINIGGNSCKGAINAVTPAKSLPS